MISGDRPQLSTRLRLARCGAGGLSTGWPCGDHPRAIVQPLRFLHMWQLQMCRANRSSEIV
jgi:hypothetical protein